MGQILFDKRLKFGLNGLHIYIWLQQYISRSIMIAIIQNMKKNVLGKKNLFRILTAKKICFGTKKNNKVGQMIKMKKFGMNILGLNNLVKV